MMERLAVELRKRAAAYRAEESRRSRLIGALLWSVTEAWIARLEAFAAQIDQELIGVRGQEQQLRQAYEGTPAPARPKPCAPCSKRRGRR
jgi:hypothetical protein